MNPLPPGKQTATNASENALRMNEVEQRAAKFQKDQILNTFINQRNDVINAAGKQQSQLIQSHRPNNDTQTQQQEEKMINNAHVQQTANPANSPQQAYNPVANTLNRPGVPSNEMLVAGQVVEALREFIADEVGRQIKLLAAQVNIEVPPQE